METEARHLSSPSRGCHCCTDWRLDDINPLQSTSTENAYESVSNSIVNPPFVIDFRSSFNNNFQEAFLVKPGTHGDSSEAIQKISAENGESWERQKRFMRGTLPRFVN